jgi:nitrate/TMAO reductase-like tetraheme cytochrome c subunit
MSPLTLRRFSRPLKIIIQVGFLAVILAALGTVGFIEYSAQPGFCDTCHLMKPYYESWASSSHNDVPCISCHYAPGIRAEAMGKLQAANQVVKYVTGTYSVKPWAEIEDAACLRSGCHEQRRLEGEVAFLGVRFDHAHHLGELRRGKQLRCTSCHSQIVQGDHLTVTPSTCYLCHFKNTDQGEPVAGCTGCHTSPARLVSPAGFVVDHPQYVEDLVSCVSCHGDVALGEGLGEENRCFNCHNEADRLEQFENTTLLHRIHIAERNVECTQCHTPIEHRIVSITPTNELDCGSCHQQVHAAQQQLYSSMYLARVSCQGCHGLPTEVAGHEQVQAAGEATCLSCHGIRYANILPSWQREMERKVGSVEAVLRGVRNALGSASVRRRAAADSVVRLAADNLELVQVGRGVHNVTFADQLLRATLDLLSSAVEVGRLPYAVPQIDLGPPVTEGACLQCHLGIERRAVSFRGRSFNHERHVVRGELACTTCHTPLDDHGGTTLTNTSSCDACHHRQIDPMNCASCHAGPGGMPENPVVTTTGSFPHSTHRDAGLPCAFCHNPPTMSAAAVDCTMCHDMHHQPDNNCLSCHTAGAKEIHTTEMHGMCIQCHGDRIKGLTNWTRQICTACHTDRTEHYEPVLCTDCHAMPALQTIGARQPDRPVVEARMPMHGKGSVLAAGQSPLLEWREAVLLGVTSPIGEQYILQEEDVSTSSQTEK